MKSILILSLTLALATTSAWAAKDSREKQMLGRMQQRMQQSEQARAQAEQEKAAALADKDTAERELKKVRSDTGLAKRQLADERTARSRLEGDLNALQAETDKLKARLADSEKQLADSVALQHATAQKLAQVESAKKQTEGELAGKADDLQVCRTHNGQLYAIGREMMQKYRDKSCQDALAQAEPFTGLKKIEVENLLETWRDNLDREKLGGKP